MLRAIKGKHKQGSARNEPGAGMKLKQILGQGKISEEEIDKVAYSSDASQIRGKTGSVVWPETAEEVRRIVKYCLENDMNVVPRGGGTGLVGGAVPENSIVIDLSRMNKFKVEGNYVIAEPGVVLEDLMSKIDKMFPVIIGSGKACTIGGMIATNAVGMRGLKYGKMGDWVEELEVVNGKGELMKIKKEKVKDFCGKEGTTGIITKAKLRLIEKPKMVTMSILSFENLTNLVEKVKELRKNKNVTVIEYIDKITSKLAGMDEKYHLMIEYESGEGNIKGTEMEEVWQMRIGLYPLIAKEGYVVIEDPEIDIEKIDKFLYWLQKNNIPTFGHISTGVVHPHFKKDSPLIKEMFDMVQTL
ncbi:MAG: FAD-binding oxidoreductase, partial [Candidatus Nanoarchaeia archaeon]